MGDDAQPDTGNGATKSIHIYIYISRKGPRVVEGEVEDGFVIIHRVFQSGLACIREGHTTRVCHFGSSDLQFGFK